MTRRGNGIPCPNCGGEDRFIPRRDRGGYRCRHCGYLETDPAALAGLAVDYGQAREQRQLSADERGRVYRAYGMIAQYAQQQLFSQAGAAALDYLHRRGLTDETIRGAGLGYLPDGNNDALSVWLWQTDKDAYEGAALGGITARQGRLLNLARDSIVFPYVALVDAESGQTETRMLRFRSMKGKGYRSPAGVGLFAGGQPCFFNGLVLHQADTVLLTEGEIKALAAQQAGIPAVAQPGVGYLPDDLIAQLAGKTAILLYDTEARKKPFTLSPGERFTQSHGEKLTGTRQRRRLGYLDSLKPAEKTDEVQQERTRLQGDIAAIEARRIRVHVARLPRQADEAKVDIDDYLLKSGADALQDVVQKSQSFELWYERHGGQGYRYYQGGMWGNSKPLANYQARIMETVTLSDGQTEQIMHRLAVRTPSGALRSVDVPAEEWADNRKAVQALRCAAAEGVADDEGYEALRAVKRLSLHGDAPAPRRVYTATGWEQIDGHWYYLTGDGAVHSQGTTTTYRAEIDANAQGNHYALCDTQGDAATGWAAWKQFLFGNVCPQPLALLLAGTAVLALVHRFTGEAAKPMIWIHNESGSLKTALTRAGVMALWGSRFTAVRADGAAGIKWTASYKGLELGGYNYRDVLLPIDDYKPDMIPPRDFTRFLQNYSESTSHTRATKHLTSDKARPVRGIVVATGEDVPVGDTGVSARLITCFLAQGAVNPDRLADLQAAGVAGHLAAFWRVLVQVIAAALDTHGADKLRQLWEQRMSEDDAALPGHKRAAGALRQNRAAWLLLSNWLQQAGYLSKDERTALDNAHQQARIAAAATQDKRQKENRYSTIFLNLVDSLLQQGYIIEDKETTCPECGGPMHRERTGWYCGNDMLGEGSRGVCHCRITSDKIIGFRTAGGQIGLLADCCWTLVQDTLRKQGERLPATQQAMLQQLETDGFIARTDGRNGYTVKARNPANKSELQRCVLLHAAALDGGGSPVDDAAGPDADSYGDEGSGAAEEPAPAHAPVRLPHPDYAAAALRQRAMHVDSQQPAPCTGCTGHVPDDCEQSGTCYSASERGKREHVPDVPDVPDRNTYIQADSLQVGEEQTPPIGTYTPGTSGTSGTKGDILQQQAQQHVPDVRYISGTQRSHPVHAANPPHDIALLATTSTENAAEVLVEARRQWNAGNSSGASTYLMRSLAGVGIGAAIYQWIEAEKRVRLNLHDEQGRPVEKRE